MLYYFLFKWSDHDQHFHSFPTRRSSDLIDDGYRATYDIAYPILKKYGFPATVFLYSDFVGAGDALTYPQMKELSASPARSEEHTSELQSPDHLVCRLLLEKKKTHTNHNR